MDGSSSPGLFDAPDTIPLRDYQERNCAELLGYIARNKHPLLHAATGSGKTVTAAHMLKRLAAAGKRCLFIAHRREIIRQTSKTFTAIGLPHGLINPDNEACDHLVHIASVDTLIARRQRMQDWLARADVAVFDEAHHLPATGWTAVRNALTGASISGPTATPYRLDGRGLGGYFDCVVRAPPIKELIAAGYLAQPVVYAPIDRIDLSRITRRGGDYAQGELERIMDTDPVAMAAVRQYGRFLPGERCVVFCVTVEHAWNVTKAFRKAGWAAECLHGKTPDRDEMIARLSAGKTRVLVTIEVVSEGFDLPAVSGAILLRPTLSTGLFQQQTGRALRTSPGKDRAIIVDLVRNSLLHGLPEADRPWTLAGGVKGLERSVPRTVRCPKCTRVHEVAPRCIGCGYIYRRKAAPIASADAPGLPLGVRGFTPDQIRAMPMPALKSLGRNKAEIEAIAIIRGFKPGWVWYVLKEREDRQAGFGYRRRPPAGRDPLLGR